MTFGVKARNSLLTTTPNPVASQVLAQVVTHGCHTFLGVTFRGVTIDNLVENARNIVQLNVFFILSNIFKLYVLFGSQIFKAAWI